MKARGDTLTSDLFTDYQPRTVAVAVPEHVRAASLEAQTAKAIARTLSACEGSRDEIAQAVSAHLARPITKNALDACCSEAREEHDIGFSRVWALARHTGDLGVFALAVEDMGHVIIPRRYLAAVEEAMASDAIEQLERRRREARKTWKGAGR